MSHASNCIICAMEFDPDELHSLVLSELNATKFKIACDWSPKTSIDDAIQKMVTFFMK